MLCQVDQGAAEGKKSNKERFSCQSIGEMQKTGSLEKMFSLSSTVGECRKEESVEEDEMCVFFLARAGAAVPLTTGRHGARVTRAAPAVYVYVRYRHILYANLQQNQGSTSPQPIDRGE